MECGTMMFFNGIVIFSLSRDDEGFRVQYFLGNSQSSMRTPLEDLGWTKATFVL
jgi:hypothetical protein